MSTFNNETNKQLLQCIVSKTNLRKRAESCETKRKASKLSEKILDLSIKKYSPHTETIANQCDISNTSLPDKTIKKVKTCSKQDMYSAHRCVKSLLKEICIRVQPKTKFYNLKSLQDPDAPFSYDHLNKTYIPFPNPNILNQFHKNKIQIDLFTECFDTFELEKFWSKFTPPNFFSPVCYINFNNYQDLLGNYTDYETLLDHLE